MATAQILVVEDENIIAKDIQTSLKSLGYAVPAVASSGKEAIKKAAEIRPDLVLMDIVLKGDMDGIEAAEHMRDRYHIPVIYLTAYGDDQTLERARATEPFGYILKPFDERELHSTIKMALYKSQMEKKLKESEGWLSTTLQSIGDAVIATDREDRVVFMNPVAQSLTGWKQEDAVGRDLKEVFHIINEQTQETVENPVTKIIREGVAVGLANHTALVARDGTRVPIEDCGSPIKDAKGHILGIVLVFHDITERKRSEEQIQRGLQRLSALHEVDLAITSTLELRVILELLLEKIDLFLPYQAATTVRLFDRKSGALEPIVCHNLDEREWKSEEWRTGRGLGQAVVETKASLQVADIRTDPRAKDYDFFRKRGLVSYLGVPLIAKGEVLGVLGFYTKAVRQFTDEEVDFLKSLGGQAAIAIHNAQLYEEIARQAAELEKASKVTSEFLGVISHELKTPLNVMMGYTGMIKEKILVDQDRALGKIAKSSNDLLAMIDSILDATRIESGAISVRKEGFDLKNFLSELKSFYDFPSDKGIGLVWDYPSELPVIKTDSVKLMHVLQNLINNAIKFTDKGHVTVSARVRKSSKQTAESGMWVQFNVADTGIGIAEDALPYVFEKFRQVDSSMKRSHGGVGLGLHIVKTFVQMLGGEVEVESELGKGSTFTVTIPCES